MIKRTIYETVMILLSAVSIALSVYALRSDRMPFFASGNPAAIEENAPVQQMNMKEAISFFDAGSALFADARAPEAYEQGHVKGAVNLNPGDMDAWMADFFTRTLSDTMIITYCSGPQCPLAKELAQRLYEMGYEKVYYLKDGWEEWKQRNLPVE